MRPFAFSIMGFAMIFGGPIFTTIAQRLGVRKTLAFAFGLWPLLVAVVLSGTSTLVLPACVVLGLLFSALADLNHRVRSRKHYGC